MMGLDLGSGYVWILIGALGIGCFALRLSFIQLHGWLLEFPAQLEDVLGYLPPAILAALATSFVLLTDGTLVTPVLNERVIAASVAVIVAWRTESMLATIVVGMTVLWGIQFLVA